MADLTPIQVLVIEDDADTRANLRDILELDHCRVETAENAAQALDRKNWSDFAAIILDRKLPDGSADELLPQIKQLAPHAAVVVATGHSDVDGAIAALRNGAADYIIKPINPDLLRARIAMIAQRRQLGLEKARSEQALRESELQFRTLVETTACMIVILRPDHSIAYFSPSAENLTGFPRSAVLGKDYLKIFLTESWRRPVADEIQRILAGGESTQSYENPVRSSDGTCRPMLWNARLLANYEGSPAVMAVGQDITNLKQAQEQLLQSERLAAIGQMMTGLAHESRNALQRSQACLEMLALDVQDRPEALEMVAEIQKAQDYLHHLYEEVRGYAAPINVKREVCHLGEVLDEAWLNLSLTRDGRKAHLHQEEDNIDLSCLVNRHSIGQLFRNILENSLSACPDPVEMQARWSESQIEGRPALLISLRDNGPGFSPEARRKIFDPFFTTKTQGTGLGMAIAKRIVAAHGGQIDVGVGTPPGAELLIRLPRENNHGSFATDRHR